MHVIVTDFTDCPPLSSEPQSLGAGELCAGLLSAEETGLLCVKETGLCVAAVSPSGESLTDCWRCCLVLVLLKALLCLTLFCTSFDGPPALPSFVGPPALPSFVGPPALPSFVGLPALPSFVGPPALPSFVGPPTLPSFVGPPALPSFVGPPVLPSFVGPPALPCCETLVLSSLLGGPRDVEQSPLELSFTCSSTTK